MPTIMPMRTDTEPKADEADWLFWLLRAHDSFYPTGSYAHSLGLEPLVQEAWVKDVEDFRRFLDRLALPSLLKTDVPIFAHAWRAAAGTEPWLALKRLASLQYASRAPAELRRANRIYGRQRLMNAAALRPQGLCARALDIFETESIPMAAAVAMALDARDASCPLRPGAAGLLYAALNGYVAAAGKLLRLGSRAMQAELHRALEVAQPRMEEALAVPESEIGWALPWWDLFCCRHENASARLFLS